MQPTAQNSAEETTSELLLDRILTSLKNDKAEDIVQIDLRGKSSIGDYMIIASGRSSRQVTAISEKLVDNIKKDFGRSSKVCLLYTSPSPRDGLLSRMPSSA